MPPHKQAAYDNEGYLIDPHNWDESVAGTLASEEDIKLDASYWPVLHFMRAYWLRRQASPVQPVPLRLCQTGVQNCRHATPACLEYRLTHGRRQLNPLF